MLKEKIITLTNKQKIVRSAMLANYFDQFPLANDIAAAVSREIGKKFKGKPISCANLHKAVFVDSIMGTYENYTPIKEENYRPPFDLSGVLFFARELLISENKGLRVKTGSDFIDPKTNLGISWGELKRILEVCKMGISKISMAMDTNEPNPPNPKDKAGILGDPDPDSFEKSKSGAVYLRFAHANRLGSCREVERARQSQ